MTMLNRAARLLAVAASCLPFAAGAADLDYSAPPYDPYASRHGSPYDDPRYRDMYEIPAAPPRYAPPPRSFTRSYRDDGYLPPLNAPPRFSDAPLYDRCIARGEIRSRLADDGWGDFHDLDIRGEVAFVKARRPSGRIFELKVDRCTGDIVRASPLGPIYSGPYAGGDPRHDRAY